MRYRDRKGEYISSIAWRKLYADPKYAIVDYTKIGKRLVETTWVGVIPVSEEDCPKLYLVQLLRVTPDARPDTLNGTIEDPELSCQWCASEADAAVLHRFLVEKEQKRQYGKVIK